MTVAQLGQRRVETAWHPDVTLFPMVGQAAAAYQMEEIAAQVRGGFRCWGMCVLGIYVDKGKGQG